MNLERKFFLRVEKFDEQRESFAVRHVAEDRLRNTSRAPIVSGLSILGPKFVQSFAFERSVRDDALGFRTIDNFPRFPDARIRRQFFSELGFESAAAPHSFQENRFEGEGSCHGRWQIADCRLQIAQCKRD